MSLKLRTNGSGGKKTVFYIVRFILQLSYELHVQTSDIFTMNSCAV